MIEEFIKWREKHKEKIRGFLLILTVCFLIFEIKFNLHPILNEIDNDYNKHIIDDIEKINNNLIVKIPQELKPEIKNAETGEIIQEKQSEPFKTINFNRVNLTDNSFKTKNEPIKLKHSPIVKGLWSLLNINFYLFILSLLWKSQKSKD